MRKARARYKKHGRQGPPMLMRAGKLTKWAEANPKRAFHLANDKNHQKALLLLRRLS